MSDFFVMLILKTVIYYSKLLGFQNFACLKLEHYSSDTDFIDRHYFGVNLYKNKPITEKMIVGMLTPNIGGNVPPIDIFVDTCMKRIYAKLNKSPIPRCIPIPPLTFLDETDNPINVKTKVLKGFIIL